ncbi:MAG: hypothetical protein ACJ8F1_13475 [Polyangia bacterium]
MRARLIRFLVGPWGGTVVTVLGLVTGLLGSLWSTEILEAARLGIRAQHLARPIKFLVCFTITAFGFYARQLFLDGDRDRAQTALTESQERLEESSRKIPELVRTLPPRDFLADLGIIFEKSLVIAAESASDVEIGESLRLSLEGIATLAQKFDTGPEAATYAANVMLFLPPEKIGGWENHVRFIETGVAAQNLRGLLVLPRSLSATSKGGHDVAIEEFALPIPKETGSDRNTGGTGWRLLPGAPMAFDRKRFEFFVDTRELADWSRQHGDFPQYLVKQLEDYFRENASQIAGFMSVPLFQPTTQYNPADNRNAIAVLNVHWSGARRLRYPEAAENFSAVIAPLRALLAKELLRWCDVAGVPRPSATPVSPQVG